MTDKCIYDGRHLKDKFKVWDYSPSLQRLLLRRNSSQENVDVIFFGVEKMKLKKLEIENFSVSLISKSTNDYCIKEGSKTVGKIRCASVGVYFNSLPRMISSIEGVDMEYGEKLIQND